MRLAVGKQRASEQGWCIDSASSLSTPHPPLHRDVGKADFGPQGGVDACGTVTARHSAWTWQRQCDRLWAVRGERDRVQRSRGRG